MEKKVEGTHYKKMDKSRMAFVLFIYHFIIIFFVFQ